MGKESKTKHAKFSDYVAYGMYRILESLLGLLPLGFVCALGSQFGRMAYHLMPKRRNIVLRNLRIAYGDKMSLEALDALALKTFRTSGHNFMASMLIAKFDPKKLAQCVEIEGLDHFLDAHSQDKGVILLSAHMGNWELSIHLPLLIPEMAPVASLYRPLNNQLLDKHVRRLRQSHGARLFSRQDGFSMPIIHLKEKGTLGVIADQHAGKHGLAVAFFGKYTSMTSLPALLHRKTKAPILPVSMCTVSTGKWKMVFHPAIQISEEGVRDTYRMTSQCASAYEQIMNTSPADVLWMHNYWRVRKRSPLKMEGIQKKQKNNSALVPPKPFRLLVFTGSATSDNREMLEQLHRLKYFRPDVFLVIAGQHAISPDADKFIEISEGTMPDEMAEIIRQYDLSQPAPVDCALDFTPDASGAASLSDAGLIRVFALDGEHKSSYTKRYFEPLETPSLGDFLDSLCINPTP